MCNQRAHQKPWQANYQRKLAFSAKYWESTSQHKQLPDRTCLSSNPRRNCVVSLPPVPVKARQRTRLLFTEVAAALLGWCQTKPRGELQLSFCELRNSNHSSSFLMQLHQQWKPLRFCSQQWGCPSLPAGLLLERQQKVSIPMGEMCVDSMAMKWLLVSKRPHKNKLRSSIGKWNGSPPHKIKCSRKATRWGGYQRKKKKDCGKKTDKQLQNRTES